MKAEEQGSESRADIPAAARDDDIQIPSSEGIKYLLFISASISIVLVFAMFQHVVVLGMAFEDLRPSQFFVPAIVGGLFGYLLAKNRVLRERSAKQLEIITQRDRLLEREITVRKQAELKLIEQKTHLEATNEELKSFSYSVSHDLRSPLRAVQGFSQALDEEYRDSLDQEAQHYIDRVTSGCQRMEEMIGSLLSLSKVTQSDVVRTVVNLSAIAEELFSELAERDSERHVVTEVEPGLTVRGDRKLLTLVMENLIGNAWKYTAKTTHPVISFKSCLLDGTRVFCIQDNGAGFNSEYADKLFTAFSRLHHHREFPGSGIGLATVQRALLRQGGMIWADGEEGKGARFCFRL